MNFLLRFTKVLLIVALCSTWMASAARAQEERVTYLSPAESGQKRGSAPGMKVKLISYRRWTEAVCRHFQCRG
jgi:hypothetical protein